MAEVLVEFDSLLVAPDGTGWHPRACGDIADDGLWEGSAAVNRLIPGEIQQYYIRVLLHSFEDDFTAVWGNVERANIEVGREVGQLLFGTGFQVYS